MPKTKWGSVIFTAVTAWLMVYIMTLYNTVLASGIFVNETFLIALKGMWLEFVIIFLCAYFISSRIAKQLAFRIVKPDDRPILIILTIQVFTVLSQVALASVIGVWHGTIDGTASPANSFPTISSPTAGTSSWHCRCSCFWQAPSPERCSG